VHSIRWFNWKVFLNVYMSLKSCLLAREFSFLLRIVWDNHFPPLQSLLDYHRIGSNFWRFYLIRIGFTFDELVSLVKVFRLFRSEWIFVVFGVWTQWVDVQHIIYWHGQCVCDALFLIKIISCFPKTIIILVTMLFSNLFGFGIQIPTSWSVNK